MTTTKGKMMVYLSDEDWGKLDYIKEEMFSDSYAETIRRMVREKYKELKEKEEKQVS